MGYKQAGSFYSPNYLLFIILDSSLGRRVAIGLSLVERCSNQEVFSFRYAGLQYHFPIYFCANLKVHSYLDWNNVHNLIFVWYSSNGLIMINVCRHFISSFWVNQAPFSVVCEVKRKCELGKQVLFCSQNCLKL